MKITLCDEVTDQVVQQLSKVEPVSSQTTSFLDHCKRLIIWSEFYDLLVATYENLSFDNPEPYILVRYVFSEPQCSHEFVEASFSHLKEFLSNFPNDTVIEGYTNSSEILAQESLVQLNFNLSGTTFFLQNSSPSYGGGESISLKPYNDSDAKKYFEMDAEGAQFINQRSPRWLKSNKGKRGCKKFEIPEEYLGAFQAALQRFDAKKNFFGLKVDGEVAGFLLINNDRIDTIVISPSFQGQGLGSKLLSYGVKTLIDRGVDKIGCLTSEVNHESVFFFEKNGFGFRHSTKWFYADNKDILMSKSANT